MTLKKNLLALSTGLALIASSGAALAETVVIQQSAGGEMTVYENGRVVYQGHSTTAAQRAISATGNSAMSDAAEAERRTEERIDAMFDRVESRMGY